MPSTPGAPRAVTVAQTRATLLQLMQDFSIECTPREAGKIPSFRDLLPFATRVYITALENLDQEATVMTAVRLAREGMRPVPHIAARRIKDGPALDHYLARLTGEAGVTDVLVIGGGESRPVGGFVSALQLLETGLFEKHGIRHMGMAGHPEGSPDISNEALLDAVVAKNRYAQEHAADLYWVTQFTFDAAPLIQWEQQIKALGNRLPIHVGLHGLANISDLLKFALRCGIGPSINVLKQQSRNILKLASLKAPDQVLLAVARQKAACPDARFTSCHFFPLGNFARTARWTSAVAAGQFELAQDRLIVSL